MNTCCGKQGRHHFSGAGLPLDMPHHLHYEEEKKEEFKTSGSHCFFNLYGYCQKWASRFGYTPDRAFVVEEAPRLAVICQAEELQDPNHSLEILVPRVVEAAKAMEDKVTYADADIMKFLDLGASGVQMVRAGHPRMRYR